VGAFWIALGNDATIDFSLVLCDTMRQLLHANSFCHSVNLLWCISVYLSWWIITTDGESKMDAYHKHNHDFRWVGLDPVLGGICS
jgi:hypothetical protein